tara:strand:+ start:9473 stop:9817 length:345 start_codon:yes stop_codon:yes gene_type:complete
MENQEKIQELQMLEQTLQNLLMQKQAFQMEISETDSALKEIDRSGEDVFKIIGQLMIKTDKEQTKKDLTEKQSTLNLRIETLDKQEASFKEKLDGIRDEVMGSQKEEKKEEKKE